MPTYGPDGQECPNCERLRTELADVRTERNEALKEGVHRGALIKKLISHVSKLEGEKAGREFAIHVKVQRFLSHEELNEQTTCPRPIKPSDNDPSPEYLKQLAQVTKGEE